MRPTGGDVLGLTSAFLYAGAVGIAAGLWRVDDAATTELMMAFYHALSAGRDASSCHGRILCPFHDRGHDRWIASFDLLPEM